MSTSRRYYVFVRHAEPEGARVQVLGHFDPALTPFGRQQAAALATTWPGGPPDKILSSDLRRCRQTAEVLGSRLGTDVGLDPRLREMHFGDWEGAVWSELRSGNEDFQTWQRSWWTEAPPNGESMLEVQVRAAAWLDHELSGSTACGRVIVVTHSAWIRALVAALRAAPLSTAFDYDLDYASCTLIGYGSDQATVLEVAAASFAELPLPAGAPPYAP